MKSCSVCATEFTPRAPMQKIVIKRNYIKIKHGDVFGDWTVISGPIIINGNINYKCICKCGLVRYVIKFNLTSGRSSRCYLCATSTHKKTRTRTYNSWRAMISRCFNKNHIYYSRYGGSGVTVCDRWMNFESFFEDMGERPDGMTLDRINPYGGYSKENCRWATAKQQSNNTKNNKFIIESGLAYSLKEYAAKYNTCYQTMYSRIIRNPQNYIVVNKNNV